MATMADVAKRAGVSLSTVSYALSGARPISDATKARIRAAMEELDFTPNALARALAARRTGIIALLLPTEETEADPFMAQIIVGAAEAARASGYHLLLWTEPNSQSTEVGELLRQGLIDGALVLAVRLDDDRIDTLNSSGAPLTMIGRTHDPGEVPFVDSDADQAAELAVGHLAGLGHETIAYVGAAQSELRDGLGIVVRLHDGMLAAGRRHGVSVIPAFVGHSSELAAAEITRLLAENPALTGAVVLNDAALAGVMSGVRSTGRSVPDSFSVVGLFTTPQVATLIWPPATTVAPDPSEIGRLAARTMVGALDGDDSTAHQALVVSRLVERSTTGPAPTQP